MRKPQTILILAGAAALLSACAQKGPERMARGGQQMDPEQRAERMERVYTEFVARWDYNGDGKASCDDINLQRSRLFRLLDEDRDGALTSGEYRHAKFEDKSFMFFDFLRVDADGAGGVDVDELAGVPHSQFLNADKDGNCIINRQEAIAMVREIRMGDGESRSQGRGRGGKGRGGKGRGPGIRSGVAG